VLLEELLNREGSKIVEDLRQSIETSGRRASGATQESIEYKVTREGDVFVLEVLGAKHIFALERGRGPTQGGSGDGESLYERILKWINDKPIQSDLKRESLAFLIARKIHREGYKGRQGVLTNVINDDLNQRLELEISKTVLNSFILQVEDEVRKINQIIIGDGRN